MKNWEKIVSIVLGTLFIVFLLTVALFIPNPTDYQVFIFRVVLAISAGAFATIVSGFITIKLAWMKNSLRAGAGLAVFVIVYLINPPELIQDINVDTHGLIGPKQNDSNISTMVLNPDGKTISILNNKLYVELGNNSDSLFKETLFVCSIGIVRDDKKPVDALQTHLRGSVILPPNTRGLISILLGSRRTQLNFPLAGMKLDPNMYISDYFRQITSEINWSVPNGAMEIFPIMVAIRVERKNTKEDTAIYLDSFDIATQTGD